MMQSPRLHSKKEKVAGELLQCSKQIARHPKTSRIEQIYRITSEEKGRDETDKKRRLDRQHGGEVHEGNSTKNSF